MTSNRMTKQASSLLILVLCVCSIVRDSAAVEVERPALVVVVSVDQWRHEYFQRFQENLAADGIVARTKSSGVWFDNCFHQHAFTYTGPGHSVFLTGAYPSRTGIIDNNWFDRTLGKDVYCVQDDNAIIIGTANDESPVSPRNLLVDTVGDQLRIATRFRSKVFGVAIKDRAAILMAGRLANAAYWMSNDGKWITTNHYRTSLPGYLRNLNEEQASFRYAGKSWNLLLKPDAYEHGSPEDSEHELPQYEMTKDFPHVLPAADDSNYIKNLACSPFGNDATFDAARQIVENEKLGQDADPDLLAINLSATDYVGHSFGPYSLEVEDMTLRTDKQIGEFAKFLDAQVGDRDWVMFVTSDHGVAPVVERAADWNLVARRNPFGDPGEDEGNIETMRQTLEAYLLAKLGLEPSDVPLVQAAVSNQVYLNANHPALADHKVQGVRELLRNYLLQQDVVVHAATQDQLLDDCSGDAMLSMIQKSFYPGRSGDVQFVIQPYCFTTGVAAATHGSPWIYDRHVPLLILSKRHWLQSSDTKSAFVSPAAIAATIADILHVEAPSASMVEHLELTAAP